LKRDILAEKRREAEASAKAKGSGEQPTGQPSRCQTGSAAGKTAVSQKDPRATAGKRKAELDSYDSGGSMETVSRRPCHCPEPGPRIWLHRQRETTPKTQ
jgi:hypothetical protein